MKRIALLVVCLWLECALAIPQRINYQGELTRSDGTPLDTTVAIVFRLYDASSGGVTLWTETHPAVTVTDGLFHVLLGSISGLSDQFSGNRWVGVTVGSNSEMSPRNQVVSVAHAYRVGTVDGASGGTIQGALAVGSDLTVFGKANIGTSNTNTGLNAFVSGNSNTAGGHYSSIAGGGSNLTSGDYSLVGGGKNNRARGSYSVVAGGGGPSAVDSNAATADYATVSGGNRNRATSSGSTVGGGSSNTASGGGTVAGGFNNTASGSNSFIGAGQQNAVSSSWASVLGGFSNSAAGNNATVCGGENNLAIGLGATIVGGGYNRARGLRAFVGGGGTAAAADSNSANGEQSVVCGGARNSAQGQRDFVGGGNHNTASGGHSFIGGGSENIASGVGAVVCGGGGNTAGTYSFIGSGSGNNASANGASVLGGSSNTANGTNASVPGGYSNKATGDCSFAAGKYAQATHAGSFVWGSYNDFVTDDTTASFADFSFTARCRSGARFYSVGSGTSQGVVLSAGGGAWNSLSDSTFKRRYGRVNTADILEKVALLPIERWSYKSQDAQVQHIGPMAQDFHALFQVGDDARTISTIDPDGIALAAIQELAKQNARLEADVVELRAALQTLLAGENRSHVIE